MLTENAMEKDAIEIKDKISKKKVKTLETANPANIQNTFDGDINLSETRKKRFRINGDNNSVLELNISDMNTMVRLKDTFPKLMELATKVTKMKDDIKGDTVEEEISNAADAIKGIDSEMRNLVDGIFNAEVCRVCADDGSMYDLFNGKFRFEHIIEKLAELYGDNLKNELRAVKSRVQKHTTKYTRK